MKILIAEDSTLYRMMIQSVVEDLGHEYLIASDGQEAWEVFQDFGADVIISDWIMPRLEGPDLCRRLRAHGGANYTYFILLTSLEEKQDFLAGMQAGADDYLTKPLDREALEVRLLAAARVTSLH
nr:response regulator [Chloroflexota bacterium]